MLIDDPASCVSRRGERIGIRDQRSTAPSGGTLQEFAPIPRFESNQSKQKLIGFSILYGGRTRARTWDPLIKSPLAIQMIQ